jgi:hypothetical protein
LTSGDESNLSAERKRSSLTTGTFLGFPYRFARSDELGRCPHLE